MAIEDVNAGAPSYFQFHGRASVQYSISSDGKGTLTLRHPMSTIPAWRTIFVFNHRDDFATGD